MPLTDREPVALAGAAQAALTAVASVLVAFDVWSPTDDQLATLAALYTALVGLLTVLARGKAWSPAKVDELQAENAAGTTAALDQRDQALKILEQVTGPKAEPQFRPFTPPAHLTTTSGNTTWTVPLTFDDVTTSEPIADAPPPAPRFATVGEHRAARKAGLL